MKAKHFKLPTYKERRCHACGEGTVRLKTGPGRRAEFRMMELPVPKELPIPTCDHCGTQSFNDSYAHAFDETMEAVFRTELRARARTQIEALSKHISQAKLERLLGVSQGYLSKLRSSEKDPSAELVAHLALLAADPKRRVKELERFWKAA